MIRFKRLLPIVILAVMLFSLSVAVPFASTTADGFVVDSDGVERYYVNGEYVKGDYVIGGFTHSFDETTGAYLGVKDTFKNVGDNTLTLKPAYETALKAIVNGGGTVYAYYTFDDSEVFTNAALSSKITTGQTFGSYTNGSSQSYFYSKLSGIFSSTGSLRLQTVNRYGISRVEAREEGGRALRLTSSTGTAAHSYINVQSSVPANTDVVVEAEFKLSPDYSANGTTRCGKHGIDQHRVHARASER